MFKEWCKEQGFCNTNSLSHVLMDGGVLSVPFDRLDDFYEMCVKCIKAGEPIFVVEQKTEVYNFFVDIDYKDEEALNLNEIKNISKVICDKIKSLGGKECIVSVAEPKKVGNLMKTGIHYNWLGLVVDQEGALALRDHIIATLKLVYGAQDWNDIVDIAVYGSLEKQTKGSGFRMPWSHKKGKHEDCQGRGCVSCNQTGKCTQTPYLPVFMYNDGPLNLLQEISQEPTVDMLKRTTVRTICDIPTRVKPILVKNQKLLKEGGFTKNQTKNEVCHSELEAHLETFIRQYMDGQSTARITKLFKHKNSYLVSTSSKYCENLEREHNSNHIWFYISGNNIMQKCFCDCDTNRGRRSGFCKDFSGRKHILSDKITRLLYPPLSETAPAPAPVPAPAPTFVVSNVTTKSLLENFINKHMILNQKTIQITKMTKQKGKYTLETTATFCEKANVEHDDCIPFIIEKGIITANCSCAIKKFTPRGHILTSKLKDTLFPPRKK